MTAYVNFPNMGTSFEEKSKYMKDELKAIPVSMEEGYGIALTYGSGKSKIKIPVIVLDTGPAAAAVIGFSVTEYVRVIAKSSTIRFSVYSVEADTVDMFLPEE